MGKFTDQELAQLMCNIYVEYYDTKSEIEDLLISKRINKGIKDLSDITHKTEKHLKQVMDNYFDSFTEEQQRKIKVTKEEIKKHKSTNIIERIEGLTREELIKYFEIETAAQICAKLNTIIKRNNNEKTEKAKQILKTIKDIMKERKEQQQKEHKNAKYTKIKEIFDTMINNGFFSLSHFSKEYHGIYGLDADTFENKIREYMEYLRKNHKEDYNNYQFLMERNTWISWEKNRYQIERIIEEPEKYDIVDYYMYINLPPMTFLQLFRYMYGDKEYSKIKLFLNKYFEEPGYIPKNKKWTVMPNYSINGETITIEKQELILKFMEENNIPTNFFLTCFTKYKNKEINIEKQKVKSLN